MNLKGIELNGTYKVKFNDTCLRVYNQKGHPIYYENNDGDWTKYEYDERGNRTYYENSYGDWCKNEYDEADNLIYTEDSYWGVIDNRLFKELTIPEIEKLLGYKIKIKGE